MIEWGGRDQVDATVRPEGKARFFLAGFLLLWLVPWAVGEAAALYFVARGVRALLAGSPLGDAALLGAVVAGCAMLLWLGLWTAGGLAALWQFLRMVAGSDRVRAGGRGLEAVARAGFWTRTQRAAPGALVRLVLTSKPDALVAELVRGELDVCTLGTPQDKAALRDALLAALSLPAQAGADDLPSGWEAGTRDDGSTALFVAHGSRRAAGWALLSLAALVSLGLAGAARRGPLGAPAAGCAAIAALLALLGIHSLRARRDAWIIGTGVLSRRDVRYEALSFARTLDADGDETFTLTAQGAAGKRTIASASGMRRVQRLARFIAARMSVAPPSGA